MWRPTRSEVYRPFRPATGQTIPSGRLGVGSVDDAVTSRDIRVQGVSTASQPGNRFSSEVGFPLHYGVT
jgi:hypothetical protein